MSVRLSPADRYMFVAKTGRGKTLTSVVIASVLVPPDSPVWETWWVDTKHDPKDLDVLRQWGYSHDQGPRRLFSLYPEHPDDETSVYRQAQRLFQAAIRRRFVLVVNDELGHVVKNKQNAGPGLEDILKRGRGLGVGCLNQTQEAAYNPRVCFSQAAHLIFGYTDLPADIERVREFCPHYPADPENEFPDDFGFFWGWRDAPGSQNVWSYYRHQREWWEMLTNPQTRSA